MDLHRREKWVEDRQQPGMEIVFFSCVGCPDSTGFLVSQEGEIEYIHYPSCIFFDKPIGLNSFPFIPFWCPRKEMEPDIVTGIVNPERFCYKRQLLQNLSQEAKSVLNVLFHLPEEFVGKNKQVVRALISKVVREHRQGCPKKGAAERVYDELSEFTWNLFH